MSVALLDVNVLIALFDFGHIHYNEAHNWFQSLGRNKWATCPLSINGCLRFFSQTGFQNARTPAAVGAMMRLGFDHPGHEFWPDSVSILDDSLLDLEKIQSGKQLTDVYLLGLAVRRGGHLVTFDRSIPWKAVIGAKSSDLKILGGTRPR
jgi:uncharacterized protein